MICATPRSGSNYLCELLTSTGQLGNPAEYFNTVARRNHVAPRYPRSRSAQIDIVRSVGATLNGLYAVKILPIQYCRVRKKLDLFHELPNLRVVRLRRRDLLGQALSLARARQTGQILASNRPKAEPIYDVEDIRACIDALRMREAIWDQVVLERDLQPLALAYEDVMRDPQAAVDQVAALMGLAAPAAIDPALIRVRVQRDGKTDLWRERFLADTGEEFHSFAG
ncbi:MAG: hypothetical protein JNN33_09155 [Rhodospirillaceae bacterium]|nr:hypothetical protein [Rhodospirillaceae bacterium]